jgi:hypothetical protein
MFVCFFRLQEVRLTDNPLTDSRGGTAARYMLIARIGRLTSLNGSNVSSTWPTSFERHVSVPGMAQRVGISLGGASRQEARLGRSRARR